MRVALNRLVVQSVIVLGMLLPTALASQAAPARTRVRLFLDCATNCDGAFLRTEVTVVDWVSDRNASDVHVIATGLSTGAGGREVVLEFIGRGTLDSLRDRHRFQTAPDASDDDERREFARVLRLGLVRYLLVANQARDLRVERTTDEDEEAPSTGPDRWNHWIFTVGTNASLDAESRNTGYDIGAEFIANRTTEDWKIRLELDGSIDRETFELDDGEKFTANRDSWDGRALVVRSLGPQWSAGALSEAGSSKPENLDFGARLAAAVEFDFIPYAEATRRRLILLYSIGVNRYDYVEETVFSRMEETRLDHKLEVAYATRQPWGRANLNATASTFLHDWSRNRLSIGGALSVRLARGLEFEVDGSYSRIRNQLAVPKGDATDEEVFLRLRELATGYRGSVDIGLSFTFGSFLNSIVNPRFNDLD